MMEGTFERERKREREREREREEGGGVSKTKGEPLTHVLFVKCMQYCLMHP